MEKKRTLKEWFEDQKNKVVNFCKDHPDVVLTVVGGLASLGGGIIKLYCSKTEYDDYVYTVTTDEEVYKIPAKQMRSAKLLTSIEEANLQTETKTE